MTFVQSAKKPLVLIAALALATACAYTESQPEPTIESLVSAEWLAEHLDDPDLVVLDCSVRVDMEEGGGYKISSGLADFEAGHIPTAGFADLLGELSDTDSSLGFAVPTPEEFSAVMGKLGVGDDTRVVLYDTSNSAWASRVWWMLRWVGFDRAAILDGGLGAWKAEDRPLSTEPADETEKNLTPAPRPELIADQAEVLAAIGKENVAIIDALPPNVYRGEAAMYGRPGHIPGAINIPSMSLLDDSMQFKSLEDLAAMHTGDHESRVITYCGGGIAASANAFVMTRLGFTNVAVYTASMQEWAANPDNPLEVEKPE